VTVFIFGSCGRSITTSTEEVNETNQVTDLVDSLQQNSDSVHWLTPRQFSPISFLHAVIKKNSMDSFLNVITMVDEFPVNWVKLSDADTLVTLIRSTKKCNCFLNPLSSFIPTDQNADIGGYAIIFLNSFRQQTKVRLGLYSCPQTNKKSADEIMKWWTKYKMKN
jgi:hypothetical protein